MSEHRDQQSLFDRRLQAKRLARAAGSLEATGFLLDRAALDVCQRFAGIDRRFPKVADIGSRTAAFASAAEREGVRSLRGMEDIVRIAPVGLEGAPSHPSLGRADAIASEEMLPLKDGAFDAAVSLLAMHAVNDLPGTLVQIRRALKPDGLFIGVLFGGETLTELGEALAEAELEIRGGLAPRVMPFTEIRDLGGLLQRAGFALPVTDSDRVVVRYDSPLHLLRDLRGMGETNSLMDQDKRGLSRKLLARFLEIYHQRFADPDGRVRATFELLTMTGWVPHESQQKPLRPGSAAARLADALGTDEKSTAPKRGP
ncbi:MAG: methyltransferase domain-containing protein [Pseudomonadota bacterium]